MNKESSIIKKIIFVIIMLITLSSMTTATANDGVLGVTPDGVYPIKQSDIMMRSEEINIKVIGATAQVTCKFVFKNLGDAQTVLMGFPARLDMDLYDGELTTEEDISVRNFTARDEVGEIPVNLIDTIPNPSQKVNGMEEYSKWYSFSVDFEENEEKILYHTYEGTFSYYSDGSVYLGYVIETGSLWKGSIGHSKVVFDFGDVPMYSITEVYPNNYYRIEGNQLIFERSDFKPDYNLKVTMNPSAYEDLQWFDWHYSPFGDKETAKKKMELFQTSPEAICKDTGHYFKLYGSLLQQDPVSALYIKSALSLPNGNEKPEITQCSSEKRGETLHFDIFGKDADGDIVQCRAEVNGNAAVKYSEDGVFFDLEKMQFHARGRLDVPDEDKEKSDLSITFIMTDASGNSDSKTLLLTDAAAPDSTSMTTQEPDKTALPSESAASKSDASENLQSNQTMNIEKDGLPSYEEVNNTSKRIIPMEEETVPLLITGVSLVLTLCVALIATLFVKTKRKGYLLFVAEILFAALSFYEITGILRLRDSTNGVMASENISLKIAVSALYWALSMFCMLAGIVSLSKKEKH